MKILDLYCGAGGAAMGLHQAFPDAEITGVDIKPQPHYPFTFVQADALDFPLNGYDFIWASPPCQEYTSLRAVHAHIHYPDLIEPTRQRLVEEFSGPWIIENVRGAPLYWTAQLCGQEFGLRVYRHRRFEAPFLLLAPPHRRHRMRVYKGASHRSAPDGFFADVTGDAGTWPGPFMGIDWMSGDELSQAVPPAYSRYLTQFIPVEAVPMVPAASQ